MLNKLSYNIMNELNEADTNAIEIKKKVFIESDKVTVKNKVEEAAPVSTNQQIIDAKKDSADKGLYTEERKDKEERLASLKTQLEKDKDQLAADEIEAIEKEIADLEAELFEKEKLNETGEWDDNDDEMKIWKEELRDKAEYIANEIHGSVASVSGFDKYQGPVAIISTPIHGDVQLWFDNEDDTGLSLLCKIAHVGWIQGSANYISDILSREVIPEDEIINESENLLKESKVIWSDQIDTSEETYNAEWQDAGYSSAEEAIADGFPDYDTWIEGDKYAESEILLDDLKNNILPQIENQANLDYIFLTGNYNSNYPDFRPSGSGGVTLKGIDELNNYLAKWDSVTIFEEDGNIGIKCADHDGSVELMLYTFATDNEEELAKMLGYTEDNFDEFENDLYYKSIDTNIINDHPEAIKPIADTITSFNESEEVKGKEVLNELGTDSTIDKLIAGDELYFRNNDGLALMVRYADTYDQPEDYDEGYTQGWERGADEEFDKVQDENFAKAKQAAEEGNVWEVLEIDETTLQPNGSVYGYLYGQDELAKFLKEVREVRVVKRLEESKKICEKCGKEVCECDKSIEEATSINSDLKKGKEDRLASLKTQLEADGDQLSDDEKKAIEDEIAQLEKEVYTESEELTEGEPTHIGEIVKVDPEKKEITYPKQDKSDSRKPEDPTKEEILNNKIEEAEVSNLKTIKSQGNIFMLEDDNQYIVGENYNEPENIIENAEIYSTKEEADKDYFNRCGITLEESIEEKDLSKDLFGSEAEKRQSEADRALEKYLDLAREIKVGNNDTITLDSAKQLLKNAYIKAKGYYSFEPEEIDRRIAKDIPDLFGDLEEGVISDLKATHLAKKASKLSKEKDFGKSAKAFAKSIEINDKSANKLDNKAKKLENKAGKLRNEAIVKRNKSVKDFTSKK